MGTRLAIIVGAALIAAAILLTNHWQMQPTGGGTDDPAGAGKGDAKGLQFGNISVSVTSPTKSPSDHPCVRSYICGERGPEFAIFPALLA
jgi:hypothetical protein